MSKPYAFGPWQFSQHQDYIIEDKNGRSICKYHVDSRKEEEDMANARLILSAPDMFLALKAMSEVARSLAVSLGPTTDKELLALRERFYVVVPLVERIVDKIENGF